jgi:hypothetical protein
MLERGTDTARIWRLAILSAFQRSSSPRILDAEDGGDVDRVVTRLLITQDTDINRK